MTSGVTVSTNNDKTGYALTSGEHTNIAGDVLSATASSYNTAGTIGQKINTTGSASDPWTATLPGSYSAGQAGYIVGHNIDALISSRSTYAGTDTTGVTTLLSRLPSALSFTAGNVNAITNAYANGQDPASLVWNYNVGGTAGSLLASKAEAFAAATAAGSYLVGTLNTVAHTQTNTYYLPNTTLSAMNAGTATVIGTVLVTYDTSNTHILSRVYTPGSF